MLKQNEERVRTIIHELHEIRRSQIGEKEEWKIGAQDTAEALVRIFAYAINDYGFNYEAFCTEFDSQHRTLQQSMFRQFLQLARHCASDEYMTDGRNEATKETAKKIMAAIGSTYLPMV